MIEPIVQRMMNGEINPLQAVREINAAIEGITRVDYKEGLKFSISNNRDKESIRRNGSRPQKQFLRELAVLSYHQAQQNGSRTPGEVHIDRGLSSKHYADRFRQYTGGVVARYATSSA